MGKITVNIKIYKKANKKTHRYDGTDGFIIYCYIVIKLIR